MINSQEHNTIQDKSLVGMNMYWTFTKMTLNTNSAYGGY